MIFSKRIYTLIVVFILCAANAIAQDRPIGYWRALLPYNTALGIATNGSTLFTITNMAFFTFNPIKSGETMHTYSKVEGMSDIGMQSVGYDISTATTILVYADGNIDLFKDNTFYNIPDLKVKNVAGSKEVYGVYTENGIAYLSTSLGVLVIDLTNYNINETYEFTKNNQVIPVTGFIGAGAYFYAATSNGLYRAEQSNPELQNFQVWTKVDSIHVLTMAVVNNVLFLSDASNVYTIINDTLGKVFTSSKTIPHIDAGNNRLLICEYAPLAYSGDLKIIDLSYQVIDSFKCPGDPVQAVDLADGSTWVADVFNGLIKEMHAQSPSQFVPNGPNNTNSFGIYAHNKNVWIAHGGFTGNYTPHGWNYGMSNFVNENWEVYKAYDYNPFYDSVSDLVTILKDEKDGTLYVGSYVSGLFILKQNGSYKILKQNSIFDSSISVFGSGQRQVIGLGLDQSDNLWVSLAYSKHQLYVKTPDSVWYKFLVPNTFSGGPLAIDDSGQVWIASIMGGGVAVYNTAHDVTKPANHTSYHLGTGVGFGNLPSNNVFCLAKDKNNNVWIGTDNGIGIVSNCTAPFTQSPPCDAQIPIVQYDQFAGYLFAGNNIRSIAVDGANRKWVGTDNGVWLLSPDASQIVYRFTADNSPLPSNVIEKISIDDVTGDVYIGTDHGLVSYRSTATEGGTANQDVLIFPDPVPSGYKGTIAIKGLAANADVRITDIGGQLVYRTKALGGQAVWNGLDYKGHRPQTGIYLIFVSSSDGSQTYTGKIMFMQ
ncbi:MAG: two-component regulator propeller domain-containing protein [Chitinophagales bacterium]